MNVDGKISYGPVTLSYSLPFALMNTSLSFANNPTSGALGYGQQRAHRKAGAQLSPVV